MKMYVCSKMKKKPYAFISLHLAKTTLPNSKFRLEPETRAIIESILVIVFVLTGWRFVLWIKIID